MTTIDISRSPADAEPNSPADTATRPETRPWLLTVEQLVYLGLGLIALIAHLWGLGDRALHHDETLHAAYSWFLYTGQGYIHDPLLHGPLLYHIGALFFWLFGDNDFTARLGAALTGTALTLTPYLLRKDLGRVAALVAAIYLLISPVFLYYGRFIRHDIYSLLCEVLIFTAIVRYSSTRAPRWLYTGVIAFAFMFVNQETSYLFAVVLGIPLILFFVWRLYRPGVALLGFLGLAVIALVFMLPGVAQVDGSHTAQRDADGQMLYTPGPIFGWYPLETEDNNYALRIRNRADNDSGRSLIQNIGVYAQDLGLFFGHPAILSAIVLTLICLGSLGWLIWGAQKDQPSVWQQALARNDPVAETAASLASDRRWIYALLAFFIIYALFFTAFFTNLLGLVTGTTGSVLYWLAQHNVERGGQPDHYYFVQLVVYEPLLLFLGGIGFCFLIIDILRHILGLRKQAAAEDPASINVPPLPSFTVLLLAWWCIGAFGIYTWAGEKMPWLTVHSALPLALFGAWAFQRIWKQFALTYLPSGWSGTQVTNPEEQAELELNEIRPNIFAIAIYGLFFTITMGLAFVLMTAIIGAGDQSVLPPWVALLFGLVLLVLLTVGAGLRWSWGWSLAMLVVCLSLLGSVYTARNAFRLTYQNGDIPREMLVYTQTSPDVVQVVRRLEEASRRRGNGLSMPVMYDNETVWTWYMRDFTAATRSGPQLSTPPDPSIMAVLMLTENLSQYPQNRQYLEGFVVQTYPLRWWFPEDQLYRLSENWREQPLEQNSLVGQALRAPFDTQVSTDLWKFLMFRQLTTPLGSSDFVIAVRPEIANQIGIGLGGNISNP